MDCIIGTLTIPSQAKGLSAIKPFGNDDGTTHQHDGQEEDDDGCQHYVSFQEDGSDSAADRVALSGLSENPVKCRVFRKPPL
jgi:hypothetical protein